uniref:Uncharacterized protein n=1 Tax=Monopterus albus TaxID=43700 RepID=A0A3Q3IRT8_MONAL
HIFTFKNFALVSAFSLICFPASSSVKQCITSGPTTSARKHSHLACIKGLNLCICLRKSIYSVLKEAHTHHPTPHLPSTNCLTRPGTHSPDEDQPPQSSRTGQHPLEGSQGMCQ